MLVIHEEKGGFQIRKANGFKNTSTYLSISDSGSEQLDELREKVRNAFSESERRNDEKIFTIKNCMINKTVETIIDAEKQNDQRIKDMINSIPSYKDNTCEPIYESNQFSFDLISEIQ
jgi:hypothetical protein